MQPSTGTTQELDADTVQGMGVQPLGATMGARIAGVDLTMPLSDNDANSILDAFHEHKVLLFRGQQLTLEQHIAFSRIFGKLEEHVLKQYLAPGHPEILTISNIFRNGKPVGLFDGDVEEWHTDYSWNSRMSLGSLLYAAEAPDEGGDTLFADTTAAYDDLPQETKDRVSDLKAIHSMAHLTERQREYNPDKPPLTEQQKERTPDVVHPVVRTHPVTGRKSLLLGSMVIKEVLGCSQEEGQRLIQDLLTHSTQPKYLYRHHWQVGDLVVWDNRATMHTVTPCDRRRHRRLLYRTTVVE
ncbi:TauD/TfdA dioxygenase family protein [Streptomyces asiaticus]|uniref:TauD/TfdA dioxygenase family protein n=1 Tax=Streptomyces asiaticus TaxID=114695 RepID=UPI003F670B5D